MKKIKKKISFLLSLIMVFSLLPVDVTFAATVDSIKLEHLVGKRLEETKQGMVLKDVEKDAEEATLQWDISRDGKYALEYYSDGIYENMGKTTKIRLQFDVGTNISGNAEANKVLLTGTMWDTPNHQLSFTSQQYHYPYTEAPTTTSGIKFKGELSYSGNGNTVAQSANELSVQMGKSLQVKVKIEEGKLKLWTNQVNKGYFTDFTLTYGDSANGIKSSLVVFPGIANAKISSTHLEDTLANASNNKINAPGQMAGAKPGVKVEFNRPKIRDGETYKVVEGAVGKKLKVTLNLETKLEADDTLSTNQAQINMDLGGNASSDKGNEALKGQVVSSTPKYATFEGDTIALYFAHDDSSVTDKPDQVIKWPALDKSMVVGGILVVAGEIEVGGNKYNINTGNVSLGTGYTYLEYIPEQTSPGETTLQITPYKYKGEVTYEVYLVSGDHDSVSETNSKFGTYKFTYDPQYPNKKLEISVPVARPTTFMIKAILSSEENNATSQIVYYNSDDPSIIVKPYSPQIREVDNIYVIPEPNTENVVEAAGMDIVWSAPAPDKFKEALKNNDKMYFELAYYNAKKDKKAVAAIFEASLVGNQINVRALDSSYKGIVKYDPDNSQIVATKVVLKELEEDYWRDIKFTDDYKHGTDYPYTQVTSIDYKTGLTYNIPNSIYLTMSTILDPSTPNVALKLGANESEYYPVTLDRTTQLVPTPSVFGKETDKNSTDTKILFNNVSIKHFVDYTLSPAKWILSGTTAQTPLPGTYEVVLYQDTYIDNATGKKQKNDISDLQMAQYINSGDASKVYPIGNVTTSSVINVKTAKADGHQETALEALRNGKIIKLDCPIGNLDGNETIPLSLQGLDPNQSYYARVRVRLNSDPRTKKNKQETRDPDYSLFSKIYGFTISTESKPIDPDEEVPPTPKDYKAAAKDNSTAVLNWKDPDITPTDNSGITYEVIRTTEQKLNDDLLKNRHLKANEIVTQEQSKKATLLTTYTTTNGGYELVDDTLQPNTVYYYYIRTVYKGLYSDWIYQPVTTANIEKPISLKAFNATKETVDISFLAKVPTSALYDTYDFGIAIQGEDGEWKTTLASSLSKISGDPPASVEEGYTYYAYRIRDLIPGKRYNIKVCVIDKSKDKIDNKYQQSLYSNIVNIRTTYDQDQQDKEDKFKEYLDRFDKEVEKFRDRAYWTVEDGTTYKYRADYLEADMGLNKEYELVTDKNSNEANYYFPISILSKMNDEKITFKIVLGDEEVYIRPNTIKNDNELLKEAEDLIDANKLEDYYLNIKVEKNKYSGTINNEEVVSPKINVDMNIVYMKQEDMVTEADIIEALEDIIKGKREKFIDRLEAKLDSGKLADDVLQDILDDILADVEEQHMKKVDKIMDKQIKRDISVDKISNAILIVHNGEHAGVNGYYYLRNWTPVDVLTVGTGFAIEAAQLGTYIFTGQKPLINTVPEVAPYQNFINQYQLTEFFTMDSQSLKAAVTKKQVYGALARMLGASKGSDYATYLENKGIKGISKLTINNAIRQDEAIYIIMQGYELMKHRDVNSISIKNRQGVQNIGAFQPVYRPYVYAAVELKIVQPQNSRVIPSKQMTATEIIAMLYKAQA